MRPPVPALLFLAIVLLASGCGGRGARIPTTISGDATRIAHDQLAGGFGIWMSAKSAREQASNPEDAERLAAFLSTAGVRLVLLECRTLDGQVVFPSHTHRILDGDEELLQRVTGANRRHGIETVPVLALFLGGAEGGLEPVKARYDPDAGRMRLAPWRGDVTGPDLPYQSLFSEVVRYRLDLLLRELAQVEGITSVCLSHAGFPSHMTDFRREARISFEQFLGEAADPWPDAVLTHEERGQEIRDAAGPLWRQWTQWRNGVVTSLMFQVTALLRAESDAEFGRPLDLALMATGYLDQRVRTGVNWVSVQDPEEVGMAELFDRLFLEFYAPVITREEARSRGLHESASLQDALETARRRVPETVERWAVLSLVPYQDEHGRLTMEGRRQLRAALRMTRAERTPVVLMDYELMKRGTAWDDVRAALAMP